VSSILRHGDERVPALHSNGGCWRDVTACRVRVISLFRRPCSVAVARVAEAFRFPACIGQDTYRGRVCECPVVNGVRYDGDCKAVRFALNNGGCWSETFSACSVTTSSSLAAYFAIDGRTLLASSAHPASLIKGKRVDGVPWRRPQMRR
jgi:hypothetical protein